jgi:hypothetical protein
MEPARVVLMYCADGPYRHLRASLESGSQWFAWGYRLKQIPPDCLDLLIPGALAEVWEVDNTREPRAATFVARVRLDFVARAEGYVPLTFWTIRNGDDQADVAADVVRAAQQGWMVANIGGPDARRTVGQPVSSVQDGAEIQ